MVKKIFVILLLLSLITFSLAIEEPEVSIADQDAEELQENIDKYLPVDDSGDIDLSGYKPIKGDAEKKIDEINLWLAENATWLKVVFGMVPAITWLFLINFWLMIVFFTSLVLNGEGLFGFLDTLSKKIEIGPINATWANILGLVIFLMLHFTKTISLLAKIITDQILFIWEKVIPMGILVITIAAVITVIVLIVVAIYCPQLIAKLAENRAKKKLEEAAKKEFQNREVLDRIVKGATKDA